MHCARDILPGGVFLLTVNELPLITATGIHPTAKYLPSSRLAQPFSRVADRFARLGASVPGDYSVPDGAVPIKSQGSLGSCVSNALAASIEIQLAVEGFPFAPLSRLWLYWLCAKEQGTVGQDTGTEVSLAVERAMGEGVCLESAWPYTDDAFSFFVPPPEALAAVLEASDNRPKAFYSIDTSDGLSKADQCEIAIRANHCPQVGAPVDGTIQSYQPGQVLTRPNPSAIIGGHSWLLTGVRRVNGQRQFRCRNSWGASYGDGGWFFVDESFVEAPEFNDIHVLTYADALVL